MKLSRQPVGAILILALALSGCAGARAARVDKPAAQAQAESILPQDPLPSTYRPHPRSTMMITNVTILDGAGARIEQGSILLEEGKVAAIGKALVAPAGTTVIEGGGRWITPGIIDVHTHLGSYEPVSTEVGDVNEGTAPNSAQIWMEHGIYPQDPGFYRALQAGVTTLQILPGSVNLFGGRGIVMKNVPGVTVQDRKFPGARQSLKMACGENPRGYYGGKGSLPSTRMGNVAGQREGWIEANEYRRKIRDAKAGKGEMPMRDLKLETLAGVLSGDIIAHIHCYRADDIANMLGVAREAGFHVSAFHHAVEAYKVASLLAQNGTCAVIWSDWWGFKLEALDAIRESALLLEEAGACVALHSDSAEIGQRLNLEAATIMGAVQRVGIDIAPEHAIKWITLNPARIMQLDEQIGSLEVGKNADVVLWSGDPFSVYSKPDMVVIDGAVIYDWADPARQPVSDFELGQVATGTN